jgi:hypothetical protein
MQAIRVPIFHRKLLLAFANNNWWIWLAAQRHSNEDISDI